MSCDTDGVSCETPRRRGAFIVLGIMLVIFVFLSVVSFIKSRGQVLPTQVSYGQYKATDGKRVFQAYNCMGCHTLVGNGGYLGPDLTDEYEHAGPAWLAAFLPSAGGWPTEGAVRVQLQDADQQADTGITSMDAYRKRFAGAGPRIQRRGGGTTEMPNLPLSKDEIGQLIAYLKYTSGMNTEGWPPKIQVDGGLQHRLRLAHGPTGQAATAFLDATAAVTPSTAASAAAETAPDPATEGERLVKDNGCMACHATDKKRLVGPGWGGLYGSTVKLADGGTVTADDAYLAESIRHPDAKVVAGYPASVMPSYDTLLEEDQVDAIVAYLHTLEKQRWK